MVKNAPIFDGLLLLINISEVKIALFPQSIMFKDNDHQKQLLKKTL
jgi:hypothetical protein